MLMTEEKRVVEENDPEMVSSGIQSYAFLHRTAQIAPSLPLSKAVGGGNKTNDIAKLPRLQENFTNSTRMKELRRRDTKEKHERGG